MDHSESAPCPSAPLTLPGILEQDGSGQVYLQGHRITLQDIVSYYNDGFSPEMLVGQFPTVPLSLVHKVIAFYLDHLEAVDRYVSAERAAVERHRGAGGANPSLESLRRRITRAKAG